jgi:hypothetical protein
MKTYLFQFLVCLAVSLAIMVHADSIVEISRPVDPLALPLLPAGTIQPVSVASFLGNQVDSVNSETFFQDPLASVSLNAPVFGAVAIVPVNLNSLSIYEPSPGDGISAALPVFNGLGPANSDLGSFLNNNPPVENPAIVPVNINLVSFSAPHAGDFDVQPMQVITPEPSESSLLVVGLAALALIFRFARQKV